MKLKLNRAVLSLALMIILWVPISCQEESLAPTTPLDEMPEMDATPKQSGSFMHGPYGNVSGTAQVLLTADSTYEVHLENFTSSNGPDLYVYLSKEIMPVNFISLGKLKSTNGNQVYSIPGNPNFAEYKYICIHCKQYNHLFGYVELK